MKFITNNKWQMAKIVLIVLIVLALVQNSPLITHNSVAQTASPSGSLMDKLNQLITESASKAAQIKNEVTKKVENKAFLGSIIKINGTDLIIQTLNSTKTVRYDEYTTIIGSKGKEIKIDTLEEDDAVATLGDLDDKNNLVAKRIIFLDNFATSSGELVWGQIQKSTGSTIVIKTKDGKLKNVLTSGQTSFYLGNEEAAITDSKPEKYLVTKGTLLNDGNIKAKFVYFIPSAGFTKPKEATASAKITASPSAKLKQ